MPETQLLKVNIKPSKHFFKKDKKMLNKKIKFVDVSPDSP